MSGIETDNDISTAKDIYIIYEGRTIISTHTCRYQGANLQ